MAKNGSTTSETIGIQEGHDSGLGQSGSGTCDDKKSDGRCILKAKPTEKTSE